MINMLGENLICCLYMYCRFVLYTLGLLDPQLLTKQRQKRILSQFWTYWYRLEWYISTKKDFNQMYFLTYVTLLSELSHKSRRAVLC